jgi:hypothetical protein
MGRRRLSNQQTYIPQTPFTHILKISAFKISARASDETAPSEWGARTIASSENTTKRD